MGTLEKAGFNLTELAEEVRGEKEKNDAGCRDLDERSQSNEDTWKRTKARLSD